MAEDVTWMMASVGCWIVGSGTVSTRTSRRPCQVSARTVWSPRFGFVGAYPGEAGSRTVVPAARLGQVIRKVHEMEEPVAESYDAVVVGAGPNGLVAANLLVDAGWSVLVLEEQDRPGGAVSSDDAVAPGHVH